MIVEETKLHILLEGAEEGGLLLGCFIVGDGDGTESCIKLDWFWIINLRI